METRTLDIDTLGGLAELPRVVRIAWERREAGDGYRCMPGRWSFAQATLQITVSGVGGCWPSGARGPLLRVPPGSALLYDNRVHRDLAYGLVDGEGWEFHYINLAGAAAERLVADLIDWRGHVMPVAPDHPDLAALVAGLPRRGLAQRAWSAAHSAQAALRTLLAITGGDSAGADDALVAEAMRLLRAGLAKPQPIAEIARRLGTSREHLTRTFAARVGVAPATWLRRQRIAVAALRLRAGAAVAATARACGFADGAHFAAVFRAHTGAGPAEFRRRGGMPGW